MPEMTQARACNISTRPQAYALRELIGAREKLLECIVQHDASGNSAMASDLRFLKELLENAINAREPYADADDDRPWAERLKDLGRDGSADADPPKPSCCQQTREKALEDAEEAAANNVGDPASAIRALKVRQP